MDKPSEYHTYMLKMVFQPDIHHMNSTCLCKFLTLLQQLQPAVRRKQMKHIIAEHNIKIVTGKVILNGCADELCPYVPILSQQLSFFYACLRDNRHPG